MDADELRHQHHVLVVDHSIQVLAEDLMTVRISKQPIYEITFSLGDRVGNVVSQFRMVGLPSQLKITSFLLSTITKMQDTVSPESGLPSTECLRYQQCWFLLKILGMPPLGELKEFWLGGTLVGHLSVMKIDDAIQVDM